MGLRSDVGVALAVAVGELLGETEGDELGKMDGDTDGAALGSEEGIDEGNELGSLLGSDDGVPDGLGISSVGAELVVGFAYGLEQQSEMIFGITKRSAKWLFMNYGLGFIKGMKRCS